MQIMLPTWPGTCRSCGAPIEWVKNVKTDKLVPFDPPVVLRPRLDPADPCRDVDMGQSINHFVTCPSAERWRRARGNGR